MTAEFEHYDARQAAELRDLVEQIYRSSYVEAIASGDPFDSPDAFMNRFDAYVEIPGYELVVARVDGEPAGQTWGWPLQRNAAWWSALRLDDPSIDRDAFTAEDGTRTFALSEIMVCAEHTGRGIARALHDELLGSRPEKRATLLVEPDNERAYARYQKWGWRRVGTHRPHWPGAPEFDVLIRP
ncbi:GNAT family N-acetyltransferase [Nocardia wallacei]|uniref:GNAT family N-acetyltransferase n=1 Tax=Nocardia wallacei TaxID=480035 RepID=UPI0024560A72|nr:GNAT family N-acetyltransferase [Nocardia wallacei]